MTDTRGIEQFVVDTYLSGAGPWWAIYAIRADGTRQKVEAKIGYSRFARWQLQRITVRLNRQLADMALTNLFAATLTEQADR
ncbi:MAG: hypothetical protein GY929_25600 [Actinomycetia bacterium]|nr:hypothetical protein [Actinomycetes bacterium]